MKTALLYALDGTVVGYVACTNDADLPKQGHERMLEVADDHPAVTDPRDWVVDQARQIKHDPGRRERLEKDRETRAEMERLAGEAGR